MRQKLSLIFYQIKNKSWLKVALIVFVLFSMLSISIGAAVTQTRINSSAAEHNVLSSHKDPKDLRDSKEPRESHERQMIEATSVGSFTPKAFKLSQSGWTVTASDQAAAYPATNAIDGNPDTFWHSGIEPATVPLPHSITIDTKVTRYISGLSYLPRQASVDGTIGRYTITVSTNGTTWSAPVATGTWADTSLLKIAMFPSVRARYIRLTALTEAGNRGQWTSIGELNLFSDPPAGPALPRYGWVASASNTESAYPAQNVLDGNATTIWHSQVSSPSAIFPHNLIIDMKSAKSTTGLTYLPRQDASNDGNIGRFYIYVSADGVTWGNSITNGTWVDDKSQKTITWPLDGSLCPNKNVFRSRQSRNMVQCS
jgi:galactose oxidase